MPKTIVFVYNTARYLLNLRGDLIRSLVSEGFRVSAIVPHDDAIPGLEALGVTILDWKLSGHGINLLREWASYRQLRRLLKKANADIAFNFTIKPVIYGSTAAHRVGYLKTFSMIPGRGYLFGERNLQQKILKFLVSPLYRRSLRYNTRVFFQNSDDRNYFIANKLVAQDQAVVINGSGVDTTKFVPRPNETIPGTFLLIARLLEEKGIDEYAAAACRLKNKYPEARFQLLGPYSAAPSGIKADSIQKWQAVGTIEYLGETDDVMPFLASCMVFVLPSYYGEGLPRTSLEALAMGKPVITTDWPGCREAVCGGTNGALVPVKNVPALADAMEKFLKQPDLARDMGLRSRELAERRFDVKRVNSTIMEYLLQ